MAKLTVKYDVPNKLTLKEIEALILKQKKKVDDAEYVHWDKKCRTMDIYEDLLNCIKTLQEHARFICDDDFVDGMVSDFMVEYKINR